MDNECLHCGRKINGRIDKKFCDIHCKSAYHNARNREENQFIRHVNATLKTNYRILKKVNPYQKTKVKKDHLLKHGFDFNYFTNIYTTKKGHQYYFIYDQGYLPLDNDFYAVVKRDK